MFRDGSGTPSLLVPPNRCSLEGNGGSGLSMSLSTVIRQYLDDKISLGRGAEELRVSRAKLERVFERLGVPKKPAPDSDGGESLARR